MKNYNLYFLSLILTIGFWATSSHAQERKEVDQNRANKQYLKEHKEKTPNYIIFEAKNTRYAKDLVTFVNIFDENGDLVCTADTFTVDPKDDETVWSACGEYKISAFLTTMDYDRFIFYLYEADSEVPFAFAKSYKWFSAKKETKEVRDADSTIRKERDTLPLIPRD